MTGTREKVGAFIDLLAPFGIVELMRTGRLAMSRGKKSDLTAHRPRRCLRGSGAADVLPCAT